MDKPANPDLPARSLGQLLDSIPDGLIQLDGAGRITYWSRGAARMFGWSAAQATGQSFAGLILGDATAETPSWLGRRERVVSHQSGGSLTVEITMFALEASIDAGRGALIRDITHEAAGREALRRLHEHHQAVIEHVNDGMIVVKDGRVAYANPLAAEIAGTTLDDLMEAGYLHRIHPDDRELLLDRQRRRLAGESVPSRYELRLQLGDGTVRWIGLSVAVVPWDGGSATLTFFADISQRKSLEKALRDTLEERETVLENSLVGIAFLTQEGTLRWSNRAMKRIFGLTESATMPAGWSAFFETPQAFESVLRDIARCLDEGRAFQGDLQMRRLDGTLFWLTASGTPVSLTDRTQGSVWAAMDITERKSLEAALAQSYSEREAIFNSALVGISFNVERRLQWVNDKYTEMTGYTREELVGQSTRLFYEDDATYAVQGRDTWDILKREGVYFGERRLLRRNGDVLWVQLAGRCVTHRNPEAGVIWTLLDITERHLAEARIREALDRQKELNDLRSRFVAMTSHEFRTPLAAILSASELLRDYSDRMSPSERAEILENIGAGVKRMAGMLDRALVIGQGEAGMLEFRPQLVDLGALCRAIADEAQKLPSAGRCRLVTRFDAPQELVSIDSKLLRHILENLLANAVKYSPGGGEIAFSASHSAGKWVFEIEDQGIGIPEEEIPHLFDSFHRASNVGDIQGTGLGLAIVKKAVDLHGGSITVHSRTGGPTRFVVTL